MKAKTRSQQANMPLFLEARKASNGYMAHPPTNREERRDLARAEKKKRWK